MTSLSPKEFKEEFRGRVADLVVSNHLLNIGNKKNTEKEQRAEEMYLKLEKWVMEQMNPMIEHPIVRIDGEYQNSRDLHEKMFPDEVSEDQSALDF